MTCSFHKFGEYFPGTGTQEDRGRGKGKGYAINVPLKDGITDQAFQSVFEPVRFPSLHCAANINRRCEQVISKILEVYRPSVVVLQCGADSLSGDKLGCFNLTMHGHAHCVQYLRRRNIPLILLGGGGYTVKNVARAWTYETACALGIEETIDPNLPWNQYFEWFGPRYRLEVVENNMDDLNVKDGSLEKVRFVPQYCISWVMSYIHDDTELPLWSNCRSSPLPLLSGCTTSQEKVLGSTLGLIRTRKRAEMS